MIRFDLPPLLRPISVFALWAPYLLIGLCCGIELMIQMGTWGVVPLARFRATCIEYLGFWPGLLAGWTPNYTAQPYTMFVSYAFVHAGPSHLLGNMLAIYVLSQAVLKRVGAWGFLALYGLAALGGAGLFTLLADSFRPMVGASGAVFGLAGGLLAWNYIDRFSAQRRLMPVLWIAIGLVALNIVHWWSTQGQLAWETHLGGFMTGWVAALLIDPRSKPEEGTVADP